MPTPEDTGSPQWVTIPEAAELLDQSEKTIRRKIKSAELVAEKRHDPEIGADRWYIDAAQLPRQPGTSAAVVPVEIIERIEGLHRELTAAVAEAEKAAARAEFQTERRQTAEEERDAARAEADRLREALEAEKARRWWQRRSR